MFCQPFLRRETKKLIDWMTLVAISLSVNSMWPTATARHKTFLSWNLTVDLTSLILVAISSAWVRRVGNLPTLLRPGPKSFGTCLRMDSEARKASYFLESFLIPFLFFGPIFFKASMSMNSAPILVASSQWAWSAKTQTVNFGLVTVESLIWPEKRLSFLVS